MKNPRTLRARGLKTCFFETRTRRALAVYSLNLGGRSGSLCAGRTPVSFVAFSCKRFALGAGYSTVAISFWAAFGSTLMPTPMVEATEKLLT